jgi:cell division protein YceG involved in septum cleavage
MVLPDGNIRPAEDPAPVKNQGTAFENSMNKEPQTAKDLTEKPETEKLSPTLDIFTIPAGASAEKIADLLVNDHWITNKEEFLSFVTQKKLASKFQAGSFELTSGMSLEEIVNQLIK